MNNSVSSFVSEYYQKNFRTRKYIPGKYSVPVSSKVFDEDELLAGVEAVLDG